MLLYGLPIAALILSFWIWHPLRTRARRAWLPVVALTAVLGLTPALLLALMRANDVPYATLAQWQPASGIMMGALALAALMALLRDALWLLLRWVRGADAARAVHNVRATAAIVALALGVSTWAALQGMSVPQVRERVVELPRLPSALDGLRVVVLADLHASPINNAEHIEQIVERANAAAGDLIVLPGDLVDGDAASGAANIAALAKLHAPHGVWAAPGNHEYYSGYDEWAEQFRRLGLAYLENEVGMLNIRGHLVAVSGVGDLSYSPNRHQSGVPPDITAVVQAAREARAELHILLAHQPRLAAEAAQFGDIDLQISGHTHGGHVWGMDRWIVAPANSGYVRGLYTVNASDHPIANEGFAPALRAAHAQALRLFVSSGAGLWAGFTLRLGVPSAIDVLILKRAAQ